MEKKNPKHFICPGLNYRVKGEAGINDINIDLAFMDDRDKEQISWGICTQDFNKDFLF